MHAPSKLCAITIEVDCHQDESKPVITKANYMRNSILQVRTRSSLLNIVMCSQHVYFLYLIWKNLKTGFQSFSRNGTIEENLQNTVTKSFADPSTLYRKTRKSEIDKDVFLKNLSITLGNIAMILTFLYICLFFSEVFLVFTCTYIQF